MIRWKKIKKELVKHSETKKWRKELTMRLIERKRKQNDRINFKWREKGNQNDYTKWIKIAKIEVKRSLYAGC